MRKNLKPLAKGSRPQTGNISDAELSRLTNIPKSTLITWSKTEKNNWRYKHYWFLKSFKKTELKNQIEESEISIEKSKDQ